MSERRPYVKNAADSRQTRRGGKKEHQREGDFLGYLRHSLTVSSTRYVFAHLMFDKGLLFDSVFDSDPYITAHQAGWQQFAQELREACILADPDAFALLEREYRARLNQENFETDASHAAIERADEEAPERAIDE